MIYRRLTTRNRTKEISENDFQGIEEIICRLRELENKIEDEMLIELPCKVGDTAYVIKYQPSHEGDKFTIEATQIVEIILRKGYTYYKDEHECYHNKAFNTLEGAKEWKKLIQSM